MKRFLFVFISLFLAVYFAFLPPVKRAKKRRPYAILLGCPCRPDGSLSSSQKKRCELAIASSPLFSTLVITGGAVKNGFVESEAMKAEIEKHADFPILCEKDARTTWENLQNVREMTGDVPVLVLTSGTHARRAQAMARQFYSDVAVAWMPEHRLKHVFREFGSQMVYIWYEMKKRF